MVQFSPSADPQGFVPSSAGAVPGRLTLMALSVLLSGIAFAQVPAPAPAGFGEAPIVGQLAQASPPPAGMAAPGHGPRMAVPGAPGAHAGPGMQRPGAGPAGHHGGPGMHRRGMGAAGPVMMLLGPGQDRALELVKATPQQRADIRRIAGAARDDLRKTRQDGRPRREAWAAAWTADRIDAAALEAERARMAAQRDAAGKRMVQAMVDIGAVLQPEQRRLLAEHWARRGGHRRAEFMDLDEHAQAVAD